MSPSPSEIAAYLTEFDAILTRFLSSLAHLLNVGKEPMEHAANELGALMKGSSAAASQGVGITPDYEPGALGGSAAKLVSSICQTFSGINANSTLQTKQTAILLAKSDIIALEQVAVRIRAAKNVWVEL